jgi:hypothetical protein
MDCGEGSVAGVCVFVQVSAPDVREPSVAVANTELPLLVSRKDTIPVGAAARAPDPTTVAVSV